MKLQKLLDAGAFTLGGDVIFYDPRRHHQVLVAHWGGGPDCTLTPAGQELEEERVFEPKPKLPDSVEPQTFKRPKKEKGLADLDLGDQ